jgi:hypothetical protein
MRRWRLVFTILLAGSSLISSLSPFGARLAMAGGDSRFGLDFVSAPGSVAGEARFGLATGTGAGWDRFPLYWNQLQASRGAPVDFSASDATVSADLAHGLAVQGILVGAPGWATTGNGVDLDGWSSFVSQTVSHYRGQIHFWEMWNEPDLLDGQGKGTYWPWGVAAYYQLLKAGYNAAKAADPSVGVLLGGLAFPYNNQDFFPQLLAQIAQDPTSAANHGYFDVLAFHSYNRVSRLYELPLGYFGTPSFAGFRPLLRKAGLNPPIWVNENGVPISDYGSGQNAPGRANQDEQAAYLVESLADGLAAGVDKTFIFQLADDGAGAIDSRTNLPAEYFGLTTNDGATRPAYTAYQSAIGLFSGAQAVTHLTVRRGSSYQNHQGLEAVTFWGTSRGKVTVAWNNDPGSPANLSLPTSAAGATVLDKLGHNVGQIAASGGTESISLPPATNNNNFDCFTPHGCDPSDYVIGGSPVILVENDPTAPAAVFDPLPYDSVAPIHLSWHASQALPPGATFDVQARDAADGVWHDWLTATPATDGLFGDGGTQLTSGHSYEFRLRAHDASGNLVGGVDYLPLPLASTVVTGGNVAKPDASTDAKIEIVWPHGSQPVSQATQANVTAALFNHGSLTSVGPGLSNTLHLWRALDNDVAEPVITGTKRLVTAGSLSYPVWDFDDVDVSAARSAQHRYTFWVSVDGQKVNANVWSHGADARTYFPQQDQPTDVSSQPPSAVDAKIEIAWPHNNLPVAQATQVNVGVDLFSHGSLVSAPVDYAPTVRLYRAINSGPFELVAVGDRVRQTRDGLTFPTWQFNDVDVSAARDPHNRIYFRADVVGVSTFPNVWTHGADARTFFPRQDVPTAVGT